jgi:hypothetical protein
MTQVRHSVLIISSLRDGYFIDFSFTKDDPGSYYGIFFLNLKKICMALTLSPIEERKILEKIAGSTKANSYCVDFIGLLDVSEVLASSQTIQSGGFIFVCSNLCRLLV